MSFGQFEQFKVSRAICDGQRGYAIEYANGCKAFHFSLERLFQQIIFDLDHKGTREVMVVGEPEQGNAW